MKGVSIIKVIAAFSAVTVTLPLYAGGKKDGGRARCEIIVAAAASLKDAMEDAIALYKQSAPDVKITPTYGASGTLRRQIEQGAPADIFISAAASHIAALIKEGFIEESSVKDMFENKVVLITPKDSANVSSFKDCESGKVLRIALGIPESVPAGDYAKQVFLSLGIWDAVFEKAVLAKDVRQVLTYVEQGEADAGVVYATDAAISSKVNVVSEAPLGACEPIIYPGSVVKESKHPTEANAFFDFLLTGKAGSVFRKYGFALK